MKNAYLSSRPHVPEFIDLAHAAVQSINHPEFRVSLCHSGDGLALAISSDMRQHEVGPVRLKGDEDMVRILYMARNMIENALGQDLNYRFKVHGSPIFATGV